MRCCDCEFRYKCEESENVLTAFLSCDRRNKFLSEKSADTLDSVPLKRIENTPAANFGVDLDRLKELAEADKEGRCLILPCKVGDTVYKLWYRACHNGESYPDSYSCCGCEDECDIKRDVFEIRVPSLEWILTNYEYLTHKNGNLFLTKEEAERALEAEKNGKV